MLELLINFYIIVACVLLPVFVVFLVTLEMRNSKRAVKTNILRNMYQATTLIRKS